MCSSELSCFLTRACHIASHPQVRLFRFLEKMC
jgi:hypothetical protein